MSRFAARSAALVLGCALPLLLAAPLRADETLGRTMGRLVPARSGAEQIEMDGVVRYALSGTSLRFPVRLRRGVILNTAFAVRVNAAGPAARQSVEFRVSLLLDGRRVQLFRRRVIGKDLLRWSDVRMAVRPRAAANTDGEFVGDLLLEATDLGKPHPPNSIVWEAPRIEPWPRGKGPNLILISVDTLRADHLGCYGYGRDTSPNIDRLAREGVLFERAISTSSWTLPAHASMLTGLLPSRHNAIRPGEAYKLAPRFDTLAEILWDHGYLTAAITGHIYITAAEGFAQGFDRFRPLFDGYEITERFGDKVRRALDWMEQERAQRSFVFLHTYAAHAPYRPSPPYLRFDPGYEGRFASAFTPKDVDATHDGHDLSEAEVRHVEALYDGGIAELDAVLGELFSGLRSRGLASNTCIVLTSDHGEEFREHGNLMHNHATLFEEMVHVPLIVRCPRMVGAPRRIDTVVSLADVTPTVLSLAGVAVPQGLDGVDLSPLWRGEQKAARDGVVSEVDAAIGGKEGSSASLRGERYKLIETLPEERRELFDLRADPGEREDVSRAHPRIVKRMLKELRARQRVGRLERGEPLTKVPKPLEDLDAATRERLRALGYLK